MRHGGGSASAGGQDPTWGIVAGVLLVLGAPFILWLFFHEYITFITIHICKVIFHGMVWLNASATSIGVNGILYYIVPESAFTTANNWVEIIPRLNYKAMKFDDLLKALNPAGEALRILYAPLTAYLIVKLFKRTRPSRLTRRISLAQLTKINCKFFPQIRPAVIEDPMSQDPDHGVMAREASPIRFAVLNHAAYIMEKPEFSRDDSPGIRRTLTFNEEHEGKPGYLVLDDDIDRMVNKVHNKVLIDEGLIKKLFIKQLGCRWTSSDDLDDKLRALYAALITQVCGDKMGTAKLLFQLNSSWKKHKSKKDGIFYTMNTKGVDALIKKHESNKDVQEVLSQHAYVSTILSALLEKARSKGKLISPDFLWLKIHNRVLWYTLNQVGCQTGWTEAAGPFAHYLAEQKIGHPLKEPFVDTAVTAFKNYLGDFEGWLLGSSDPKKANSEGTEQAATA